MRTTSIFCIVLLNMPVATLAQNNSFKESYEQFRKAAVADYQSFRAKANAEYAEWMRRAWEQHQALPVIPAPKEEEKPPVTINDDERDKPIETNPIPVTVVTPPVVAPQPRPIEPIKEVPIAVPSFTNFDFYGIDCKVRFGDSQKVQLKSLDNDEIADKWNMMADDSYNNTVRDCLEYRVRHKLCDWAYLQFIDKFASSAVDGDDARTLLEAYLLCQSGYKIRLAKSATKLYYLFASSYYILDMPRFRIDGEYFYSPDCKESKLDIFNHVFPHEQLMSLWITDDQGLGISISPEREIASKHYPKVKIKTSVNQNLIDFFNTYPASLIDDNVMTKWAMYANTPLSEYVKKSLYPQLRSLLKDKKELETVEILLNLIQTGFEYEFDDVVWGHDRAFFAEESLFYPYCDCEDRSILLSRLVRDLVGLDVLLVFYPGHLAMAVAFSENVKGDYIELDGQRYIICDPTYIGAPVGLTMPDMDNATAKVILLKR